MNKNKINLPKPTKGHGFCGVWQDGNIGWNIPNHLSKYNIKYAAEKPYIRDFYFDNNDRLYLCEINIKPIKNKLGRPITRFAKKLVEQQ